MLSYLKQIKEINVVNDQFGSHLSTLDCESYGELIHTETLWYISHGTCEGST